MNVESAGVVDQEVLPLGSQGIGQFRDQITVTGSARQNLLDNRMRSGQHLQGVAGREEQIVGPGVLDLPHELLHVKGIDGLLEWQRFPLPGHCLDRPMHADTETTFRQPVGIGPLIGFWGSLQSEKPRQPGTRCPGSQRGDEMTPIHLVRIPTRSPSRRLPRSGLP